MSDHDHLSRTLDVLVPPADAEPDAWDEVLRRAALAQPRRRRGRRGLAVALATLAAVCAAVLIDPFGGGDRDGVLDRALAAVGDGPVLRVVTETQIGGTLVELDGERRTEIRATREALYDPQRGMRWTLRLEGVVLEDYGVRPGRRLGYAGEAMQAFTRDYREALRSGRAHVLREEEVDGDPVYWIRVPLGPKSPTSRTPCRPYKFCQDVAISRETYAPLYLSSPPGFRPRALDRILTIESLPAGSGRIPGKATNVPLGFHFLPRRLDIGRSEAERTLGAELAWPGRRLAGLRLERIDAVGIRPSVFTPEMRRPRYGPRERVIRLVFARGRDRLVVNQARRPSIALNMGPGTAPLRALPLPSPAGYAPAPGWALLTAGGRQAVLRHHGLVISVFAARKDLVLKAVQALRR
jgi:hypothetical protein